MTKNSAWPQGFWISPRISKISSELIAAFATVPTAHASDCLGRSIGAVGLRAFHGSATMCGPAVTVRTRPGDNLMIHKALSMMLPGDVLVVDGGGDVSQAVVGGLMRTSGIVKKLGGFVVDGAVRDLAEFAEGGLPCYAKDAVHRGPSKDGPGEINVPIACAGMAVMPGDLMLGDADGVICIPSERLEALLPQVKAHAEKEAKQRNAILTGTTDPNRFNDILLKKGVHADLLKGL